MNKRNLIKTLCFVLCLLAINGCNRFHKTRLLQSIGYDADECCIRDATHHKARYDNGTNPGRTNIWAREYRCRIERICIGKSELENEKCKIDAGNYWGFTEDNQVYKILKHDDDKSEAFCTNNPDTKRCSPKWHPQENFNTNPYWNKETKSYILPEKVK